MPFTSAPGTFHGVTSEWLISHTTFSGSIVNAGTIGAGGIVVISSTFTSGNIDANTVLGGIHIDSSSKILASSSTAIAVEGQRLAAASPTLARCRLVPSASLEISTFAGGIINTGTISAAAAGIFVGGAGDVEIPNFSGGITNRGQISAGTTGIRLGAEVLTIAGNVINTGTISGQNGINLLSGLISGAIIDSGTTVAGGVSKDSILADGNVTGGINVASGGRVVVAGLSGPASR